MDGTVGECNRFSPVFNFQFSVTSKIHLVTSVYPDDIYPDCKVAKKDCTVGNLRPGWKRNQERRGREKVH